MESAPIIIFIIVIVVFTTLFAVKQRQRKIVEVYTKLAEQYGGRCEPGGWFSHPKVKFQHAGARVAIDIYSTGGENATHYTQVHFYGRCPNVRCEVYPEGGWSRVKKFFGMQDIEIGSPRFDERYIIQGDDGAALRSLLNPGVQRQIARLRLFLANDNIYVSFSRHELLVKKLSFIKDLHTLREFTKLAIGLYDQAVLPTDEGIEFVKSASPPKLTEALCQICGETIESGVVFCRRCKTPHHRECWEYYGACSTYGCLETSYLRPESKRARRAEKAVQSK